jgi:hypothetical protein
MRIFLSVPFSSRVNESGKVMPDYRESIEDLLTVLRNNGHNVFCSLEHANWEMNELAVPEAEFAKDLAEIDACDKLIILLEEKISAGVQLENGYAFAKGRQLETYQIGRAAWSNMAFARMSGAGIIPVKSVLDFVHQAKLNNTTIRQAK